MRPALECLVLGLRVCVLGKPPPARLVEKQGRGNVLGGAEGAQRPARLPWRKSEGHSRVGRQNCPERLSLFQ